MNGRPRDRADPDRGEHDDDPPPLPGQRAQPEGPFLAPADDQVDEDREPERGGDPPGEAERDGDGGDEEVVPPHEHEQRRGDERDREGLGVRLEHDRGRRVEAPQARGDEGEPLALRLPGRVVGGAEQRVDEHDPDGTEDEVEDDPGDLEGHPRDHEALHEVGVERVERPRAVGDEAGVRVPREGHRVAVGDDAVVPDAVPEAHHVADRGVGVTDARGVLEPGGRHPDRDERDDARDGVDDEQGEHRPLQRPAGQLVPALRGEQPAQHRAPGGLGGRVGGGRELSPGHRSDSSRPRGTPRRPAAARRTPRRARSAATRRPAGPRAGRSRRPVRPAGRR